MKTPSIILVLGLTIALIGCSGYGERGLPPTITHVSYAEMDAKARIEAAQKQRESYAQAHPEYQYAILNRLIAVGMSANDVTASLGNPSSVNKTVSAYGLQEQWGYHCAIMGTGSTIHYAGVFVYFDNGRVSSWQQNSSCL